MRVTTPRISYFSRHIFHRHCRPIARAAATTERVHFRQTAQISGAVIRNGLDRIVRSHQYVIILRTSRTVRIARGGIRAATDPARAPQRYRVTVLPFFARVPMGSCARTLAPGVKARTSTTNPRLRSEVLAASTVIWRTSGTATISGPWLT